MSNHRQSQNQTRPIWIILNLLIMIALLLSGCGAEQPKVYRVGVLSGLNFLADLTDGFKAKMAELGYVEGENIVYDVKKTDFDIATYQSILQGFVTDKVDLIVVFPTEASIEAKAATQGTDIPVVFAFALIEGMGLVDGVREPGGNITGVRYPGPDIALKRFEVMRELTPDAKRMLIPYQRDYPIVSSQLAAIQPVAEAAGITLIEVPAANAAELEAALQAQTESPDFGVDAVLMLAEPLMVTPDAFIVAAKFAQEHQAPIGGTLMAAGDYGSVFGVNVNNLETGKQAAPLVDKIFKGTPAGTIPVVSSESFLQVNYKV